MTLRRVVSLVFVLLLVAGAVPACSSSSKSDSAAGSQDANADSGSCPFSGSTQPQSQPGDSSATKITSATPETDGCIDNVTLKFSPTLAASHFEYESGAPVLAVTLTGATLGGGLSAGTTQSPKNLNHVQKVVVSAPSGSVKVEITLDEKRPFLVGSSKVPAELELSIG